ncbi:MAG TPA: PIN domain-containing protein [Vicinamibacteria bacterium]
MIAVDTSSMVAYLRGDEGPDTVAVDEALAASQACLPPAVLAELLSDPRLPVRVRELLKQIPLLAVGEEYWERVGLLRARVIARGRKARLADSLVAQSCLDHDLPLITRDTDFRNFARSAGLRLLP